MNEFSPFLLSSSRGEKNLDLFLSFLSNLLESRGTSDNLQNLLGDRSLTSTVVFGREGLGELSGVVARRLHGLHTGGKLRRDGLLEGTEDLAVEVQRKNGVDDLERVLLEDHVVGELLGLRDVELFPLDVEGSRLGGELEDLVALGGDLGGGEGDERPRRRSGGDEGDELGVKELDGIGLAGEVGVEDLLGDLEGLLGVGILARLEGLADGVSAALEVGDALLADEDHVALDAGLLELGESGLGLLDHEGVVAAAETAVTGDDNEGDLVDLALGEEGKVEGLAAHALDEATEDGLEGLRERTGGEDGVLGTTHLGGSDELHRHGDLTGVLD
mmetsp:Transcript_9255/g.17305  ORF Transcript_9255/g.17305 Transcript_9255/m.17305 type:complete len:331 (+) Transcript_9255:216-1208(+)